MGRFWIPNIDGPWKAQKTVDFFQHGPPRLDICDDIHRLGIQQHIEI